MSKSAPANRTPASTSLTADPTRSRMGAMAWKVLSTSATIVATVVATKGADNGWRALTGRQVPVKGDYEKSRTSEVIAYTALSSMLVAGARVAAERKAAEYYRDSAGHLPAALTEPTKAEKKAAKKLEKEAKKAEKSARKLRQA